MLRWRVTACPCGRKPRISLLSLAVHRHEPAGCVSSLDSASPEEGGRWRRDKQQTEGLADFATAVLGHAHPRGPLPGLRPRARATAGFARDLAPHHIFHRQGRLPAGRGFGVGELCLS